mmetsp:Transcript_182210/g.443422  ORF Transcript_182210/g.443422 Transcript_182210/m.443422 type:complete len:353 (+) Transcript_182210:1051-2109(+)
MHEAVPVRVQSHHAARRLFIRSPRKHHRVASWARWVGDGGEPADAAHRFVHGGGAVLLGHVEDRDPVRVVAVDAPLDVRGGAEIDVPIVHGDAQGPGPHRTALRVVGETDGGLALLAEDARDDAVHARGGEEVVHLGDGILVEHHSSCGVVVVLVRRFLPIGLGLPYLHVVHADVVEALSNASPVHVPARDQLWNGPVRYDLAARVGGPLNGLQTLDASCPLADSCLDRPVAELAVQADNLSAAPCSRVLPVAGAAKQLALVRREMKNFRAFQVIFTGSVGVEPVIDVGRLRVKVTVESELPKAHPLHVPGHLDAEVPARRLHCVGLIHIARGRNVSLRRVELGPLLAILGD